jgi:nucleotide-binding universal stress UspA family protein
MGRIVVGYDGSEGAERALRWAATEAGLRGARLDVVCCWQFPLLVGPTTVGSIGPPVTDQMIASANHLAEQARVRVAEVDEQLDVHVSVVEGHPASALVDAAASAELLVVGSHGRGAFASLLIGSVSLHCTAHAPCPVVVVRPGGPT